ncbi:MAG: TetR/AcrR family transcriptional regulator [Spirochaetae bacterium HGW-Spirochaetae-3]|jgi:AcrR family transcriptional regulator|nr:MAG: TetR/AcrR family transcriptional regulator [Spirochaetae bacterium HGW-Spirochaetae-3]
MGITERKTRERKQRRALILQKARDLILENGVDALNMQDIADESELSKATLYLYFENKDALLLEILGDATKSFVEYVKTRLDPSASGIEALNTLWASYIGIFGESQDIFVLTGIMRQITPASLPGAQGVKSANGASFSRMRSLISEILSRGVADGTLESGIDPDRLSRTIITIAMAIIDDVARLPREARDARLIEAELKGIFELMLRGVAARDTDRTLLKLPIHEGAE